MAIICQKSTFGRTIRDKKHPGAVRRGAWEPQGLLPPVHPEGVIGLGLVGLHRPYWPGFVF